MKNVTFLIPAYNKEKSIGALLDNIKKVFNTPAKPKPKTFKEILAIQILIVKITRLVYQSK